MIEKGYVYIVCDRCGADTYFIPRTKVIYGSLVTNERPDGWKNVNELDLCPECAKEYKVMIDNFFKPKNKGGDTIE